MNHLKLEVAIEVLGTKLGINLQAKNKELVKQLLQEKERLYLGDKEIIEKVYNQYGPEIKREMEKV